MQNLIKALRELRSALEALEVRIEAVVKAIDGVEQHQAQSQRIDPPPPPDHGHP